MFNLATLFVDIVAQTSAFDRSMASIHGTISRADLAVSTFTGNLGLMFARAAVRIGGGLFDATITSAADLHETLSKTEVIFASAAQSVIGFANEMADTFMVPKQGTLDAIAIFGEMGKTAGMTKAEMADFGIKMTKIAVDAKSFVDVPIEQALHKIQSGLAGHAMPLRAYGVFINAAEVAHEALAMGLAKTRAELTEGDKIMARASLITKGLSDANGDMARTFGETRNQMAAFWGGLKILGTDIGQVLMPAFDGLMHGVMGMLKGMVVGFKDNRAMFEGWVQAAISGGSAVKSFVGDVGAAFGFMFDRVRETFGKFPGMIREWLGAPLAAVADGALASLPGLFESAFSAGIEWMKAARASLHFFGDSWEIVQIQAGGMLTNLTAMLSVLPANMATIAEYVANNWYQLITDALNATATAFQNFVTNMQGLGAAIFDFLSNPAGGFNFQWTPLLEGFKATAAALPELIKPDLISVQDQIDAVTDRTAGKMAEELAAKAGPGGKTELQGLAEAATRASKMGMVDENFPDEEGTGKSKKNEIVGAAEFASKLRLAQGSEDVPQKQLSELEKIREQEKINGEALAKIADQFAFGAVLA